MSSKINEKGNRYGKLLVVKESPDRSGGHVRWRCVCDCGKRTTVDGNSLRGGSTTSCGCAKRESVKGWSKIDERGNRYGRLSVIKESPKRSGGHVCWRCICDCGNYATVDGNALRRGTTLSCGCYKNENIKERRASKRLFKKTASKKSSSTRIYKRKKKTAPKPKPTRVYKSKKAVSPKTGSARVYKRKGKKS